MDDREEQITMKRYVIWQNFIVIVRLDIIYKRNLKDVRKFKKWQIKKKRKREVAWLFRGSIQSHIFTIGLLPVHGIVLFLYKPHIVPTYEALSHWHGHSTHISNKTHQHKRTKLLFYPSLIYCRKENSFCDKFIFGQKNNVLHLVVSKTLQIKINSFFITN